MPEHELIPLAAAAARALGRLLPEHVANDRRSLESLNLVAVAISALIPVYSRSANSGIVQRVTEAELSAGRFADGAARFVLKSGVELPPLLVRQADADTAIEKLVADYVGMSYSAPPPDPAPRGRKGASAH